MNVKNNATEILAKGIKAAAKKMATIACGSASIWGAYQPVEPKTANSKDKK